SGTNCAAVTVREYNKAIAAKWGIENLITCVVPPTLETASEIFNHRGISLLVVTGGPAVAKAAMAAKKRSIVAGPGNPPVVVDETKADHVFVQEEQMMPFVPFVRVKDVNEAINLAIESEHGYRHTALIHSRNLDTITKFGKRSNVTLFVVNGASMAGLGLGGQGHLSYSVATPTGEGITTPLTFTRYRRGIITGSLRMI